MGEVEDREAELTMVCSDCEGRWAHAWIERWSFTHCPRCAGELRIDHHALTARWRQVMAAAAQER